MLPNFLIIGAPKSGSTSLYNYLRQHPQIYMSPVKEPHFFLYDQKGRPLATDSAGKLRLRELIKSLDTYQALFAARKKEIAIGEASIRYLYSEHACRSISQRIPDVKLVVILRHPVERAYSNFLRDTVRGTEPCTSFEEAMKDGQRRLQAGWFAGLHQHLGYYYQNLANYYQTFDHENIKVYLFDDLINDPNGLIKDLYTFLGVDKTFLPDLTIKHNVTGKIKNPFWRILWMNTQGLRAFLLPIIPISFRGRTADYVTSKAVRKTHSPPLPARVYNELLSDYQHDILKLQDLIGRDLSHWLAQKPET